MTDSGATGANRRDRNAPDHFATCPKCDDLNDAGRYSCATCGTYLFPTNKRERSFCRYCGAMTPNLDACCDRHRDLLPLDHRSLLDLRSAAMPATGNGEEAQAAEGTEA